ncbi:rhomboid family intramembrane serine protease [Streptomyces sp. NPDC091377]|uniref:rhomboid family intramembrane serine protease n=1 Tax=Streptomyces sp. NPDC091377 TaxID=3365995 RepID=UPI00380D42FC
MAGFGTGVPGGGVRTGRARGARVWTAARLMLGWVALLWLLEVVDVITGHELDAFGVSPREPSELVDVVPAAFVHFGFGHLAANTVPLLVLGFLAALGSGIHRFLALCALIVVADGVGVWLVAPDGTNTAGASGLVFGLFGYLVVTGFVERRPLGILAGVLVAAIWGTSFLAGLAPQEGISWQGHLIGLIAGVVGAFLLRRRPAQE